MAPSTAAPPMPQAPRNGQLRVMEAVRGWIDRGELSRGDAMPTMRRIAETLDVDKATVCRALATMQEKGLIKRQGRRLHLSDQALDRREPASVLSNTVLVVTSADTHADEVRRGWLGQVIEGLLGEAHARQCNAMVVHPKRLETELGALSAARPLGFVMIGVDHDDQTLARIEEAGLPLVLYGDEFEAHGHDMITPDHVTGTRDLARGLIERGAKRLLRLWVHRESNEQRPIWLGQRDDGFEQAVRGAGLAVLPPVEFRRSPPAKGADRFEQHVREIAGRLVEHLTGPEPIDAIMVPSDGYIPEVAAACRLFGKTPNKDVLLAGYDNDWATSDFRDREPTPPLLTTAHDTVHLGQALLRALLQRANDPVAPPQRIALPPRLVESADYVPASHP